MFKNILVGFILLFIFIGNVNAQKPDSSYLFVACKYVTDTSNTINKLIFEDSIPVYTYWYGIFYTNRNVINQKKIEDGSKNFLQITIPESELLIKYSDARIETVKVKIEKTQKGKYEIKILNSVIPMYLVGMNRQLKTGVCMDDKSVNTDNKLHSILHPGVSLSWRGFNHKTYAISVEADVKKGVVYSPHVIIGFSGRTGHVMRLLIQNYLITTTQVDEEGFNLWRFQYLPERPIEECTDTLFFMPADSGYFISSGLPEIAMLGDFDGDKKIDAVLVQKFDRKEDWLYRLILSSECILCRNRPSIVSSKY